jgi:hypothetical protein
MLRLVAGGVIDFSANEEIRDVKQRLLSPAGLTLRVPFLDNVKSLRFSWAELEGLITAPIISGHQMYTGEGRRPNDVCWLMTLNGASLSTDMAQRAVVIKLKRPERSDWEDRVRQFALANRQAIVADILACLRAPRAALASYSRWGAWSVTFYPDCRNLRTPSSLSPSGRRPPMLRRTKRTSSPATSAANSNASATLRVALGGTW